MASSAAPLSIGTMHSHTHTDTHTHCCNIHTQTHNVSRPPTEKTCRFEYSHWNIEKVHLHMQTDIFWSDHHRKASSRTHTQYIDVCRCRKTCEDFGQHTQTHYRLTHSTTADFILNVTPPSGFNSQWFLVEINLLFFQFTEFQQEVWKPVELPINFLPENKVTSLNCLTLKNLPKSEILQWNVTEKSS